MTTISAAPKRGVFASFAFLLISMMLSAQASAFDVGGFKYDVIVGTSNVELGGCVSAPCAVKDIVIPATVVDSGTIYSVTTIGSNTFVSKALTSVIIPNSVTSIGDFAFEDNALTKVIIPDSVETIGDGAFTVNELTSVTIPDSVTSIGSGAFYNNALTSAAFLGDFGTFDLNMFGNNTKLTLITYCQGATDWDGPRTTFNIGGFDDPVGLKATSTVCAGGFKYDVIVGTSNVELVGCVSAPCAVENIVIPATVVDSETTYSVTSIGAKAFSGSTLESVTIPDSVTSIGYQAFAWNDLTSVTISNSVTSIGDYAFAVNELTSVTIPDSVTSIGRGAFSDNELTSVTIPDSVTSIGDSAFEDNTLTSVAFLGNFGTFNLNMFRARCASESSTDCWLVQRANLATITYAQGATGWDSPQRTFTPFTGPTGSVTATPAPAAATPVPTSPLWLLGMMAALLSLVAVRKLHKA